MKKYTLQDLQNFVATKGGRCLSPQYLNYKTKYDWECSEKHTWSMVWYAVLRGQWCPACAIDRKRFTIEDCQKTAAEKGGRCLDPVYINSETKMGWECGEKHAWKATYSDVKRGHWCPSCYGNTKQTLDDYQKLAKKHEGLCLGSKNKNAFTKIPWQCKNGHVFESKPNDVQQGHWCPYCAVIHSKPELELFDYVNSIYPDTVSGQRKLLKNHRFELDIYIPSLNKAIELDGDYWHNRPEAIARDLRKSQQCQEVGIKLLRIKESDWIDNKELVKHKVETFLSQP